MKILVFGDALAWTDEGLGEWMTQGVDKSSDGTIAAEPHCRVFLLHLLVALIKVYYNQSRCQFDIQKRYKRAHETARSIRPLSPILHLSNGTPRYRHDAIAAISVANTHT